MGSKLRHSRRREKAGASDPRKVKTTGSKKRPSRRSRTEFDALLGRFSEALSILATATRALGLAQEDLPPDSDHDIGEDVVTLERGVAALRSVYNELDLAIREVRDDGPGDRG